MNEYKKRREVQKKLLATKTPAEHRFEKILKGLNVRYHREWIVVLKNGHTKYLDFFVGRKYSTKSKVAKKALRKNKPIPWYGIGFEIDGGIHDSQQYYDINRDTQISTYTKDDNKIFIVRFTNNEVFENPELVTMKVKETLRQMKL